MGRKYVWIGGYDRPLPEPMYTPWLVAPDDDESPYYCCKCPCVEYYTIFAFRAINMTDTGQSMDYNWCNQYSTVYPMGVQEGTHHVHLDRVFGFGTSGYTITIDSSAGLYEECGRTIVQYDMGAGTTMTYEIRAYRIADQFECYDEFREACFSQCSNLPCDTYDPDTHECTHHYLPDSAFVFDGTHRPYYGYISSAISNYGCLYPYWENLASCRFIPRYNITWNTMQMQASVARDQYNCLEWHTEQICDEWDTETGECTHWSSFEMCDRMGLYAASCTINGSTSYYTLIWNGQGDMPDRTTSANVGWLGSALSSAIPTIQAASETAVSTWEALYQTTENNVLCSDWDVTSNQYCTYYYQEATGKQWWWQAGRFRISKPSCTPSDVIGVKLLIVTRLRHYTGDYESSSSGMAPMPEPIYTETTTTEVRDVLWNTDQYLTVADGLTVSASATACNPDYDHSNACVTPCYNSNGGSLPYEQIHYDVKAMDYLYNNGDGSSGSSSSSGSN